MLSSTPHITLDRALVGAGAGSSRSFSTLCCRVRRLASSRDVAGWSMPRRPLERSISTRCVAIAVVLWRYNVARGDGEHGEGIVERRRLGQLEVSAIGLGCVTMTPFYGEPDPASAIATIRRATALGIDFLDTSDAYDDGRNEELISQAVDGRRREYVIASKFGNLRRPDGTPTAAGRPAIWPPPQPESSPGCPGRSSRARRATGFHPDP